MGYVLEVLNPRNAQMIQEPQGLTAPRPETLDGKRIAIVSEKPDGCQYLIELQMILRKRHPTSEVSIIQGIVFNPMITLGQLKGYDAFIYGVRNTAAFNTEPARTFEKGGIPGVHLCVGDNLYGQTKRNTIAFGLPGLRMVKLPTERWPGEDETESFAKLAEDSVEDIEKALTAPLTEEEKNPVKTEFDGSNLFFEGEDYQEAFEKFREYFFEKGYTDGMAVAPPTPEAVRKMLAGTSRDPAEVIEGNMTPGYGVVTVEKIAANAVMAGAKPEYLPVIITTVEMLCDQHFGAFHVIATVCSTNLLIEVSGPIAKEIGMNSGFGYLGPGNRANSTIGRAVSLCCINLGHMDFRIDGGMKGNPSRYCNLTFTESEDLSPWKPFHETMGYAPEDSTVMIDEILHIDGNWPFEIEYMPSCAWTDGIQKDLERIADRAVGALPSNLENAARAVHDIHKLGANEARQNALPLISHRNYILVLYPGLARELAANGWTRDTLAEYIAGHNRFPWDELGEALQTSVLELAKSGRIPYLTEDDCRPGGMIPIFDTNRLAILVAGPLHGQTVGLYSIGSYGGMAAPVPIKNQSKVPFFLKKITGATLTKAGR